MNRPTDGRYDQTKRRRRVRLELVLTQEHVAAIAALYGMRTADDTLVRDWATEALVDALREALASKPAGT